ncbi:DNA adenine methylase [Bacillus mexicanus]|uniref:DNA adenine methylase n=1 Tax=Bacillus mexicanus TaxID=2834415 RepID=UPI003D19E08D
MKNEKNTNSTVKRIKGIHSPIRWFGGKHYLAKDIIPLIPEHHCYVETFAGGGHVLTQKEPSKVEVYNDIDGDLINFLLTLRNSREELLAALKTLPTSRLLSEEWSKQPLPKDNFERAVRWYYLLRHLIVPANNEDFKSGFRAGKIKNTAFDYQNSIVRLKQFEERLRNVLIECLDFREIIKRYDGPNTFFYIDPPYVGRENYYKGGFTEKDHIELAELLRNIKGKALVSYYPDPLIESLYKDWNIKSMNAVVGTGVHKAEKGQSKKRETELFIMNYDSESNKIDNGQEALDLLSLGIELKEPTQLKLF